MGSEKRSDAPPSAIAATTPEAMPSKTRKRRGPVIASVVLGAACLIGAAINAVVDLSGGNAAAALISAASSALTWVLVGLPLLAWERKSTVFPLMGASTLAYLWFLEGATTGKGTWFLPIGLPIALASMAVIGLTAFVIAKARRKGPNIVSFILIGGGTLCAAIEIVLDLAGGRRVSLGWSSIVLGACLALGVVFLDFHRRLRSY